VGWLLRGACRANAVGPNHWLVAHDGLAGNFRFLAVSYRVGPNATGPKSLLQWPYRWRDLDTIRVFIKCSPQLKLDQIIAPCAHNWFGGYDPIAVSYGRLNLQLAQMFISPCIQPFGRNSDFFPIRVINTVG